MKVSVTYDFGEVQRYAINQLTGRRHKATREELMSWMRNTINSTVEDVVADYEPDPTNDNPVRE